MASVLSHEEARRAYDRIGRLQDSQGFYEDRATSFLVEHGELGAATSVFEFGCGTGRFAEGLLERHLKPDARYRGIDLSPKMVSIAQARLAQFGERAVVVLSDGEPPRGEPSEGFDRFVSTYVFDLLSEQDIRAVLHEAHRMLRPGGLLCLAGLSTGESRLARAVEQLWCWIHERRPALLGGCRPIDVRPLLSEAQWALRHHTKIQAFGVSSEALVAARR